MFTHMLVKRMKENLVNNISEFQTAKPGHRSQENIFVIKSLMALKEKYREPLLLQMMDLETFFDKESLVDVLGVAHTNQVQDKEYRLLYNINKRRRIKVQTSVGISKEEIVNEGLSQGNLDSGILSSASTDNGLMIFFKKSIYEIFYN